MEKDFKQNSEISKQFFTLGKKAINKINNAKKNGLLDIEVYKQIPVKEINFEDETYHYDWVNFQVFEVYKWKSFVYASFFEDELKNIKEYSQLIILLTKEYSWKEEHAHYVLRVFLDILMKNIPDGLFEDTDLNSFLKEFANDINSRFRKEDIKWNVALWLTNVYLENDEIEIYNGVWLKRPTKDQLALTVPHDQVLNEREKLFGNKLNTGAILEFSIFAVKEDAFKDFPEKVSEEIEHWLSVLRLYKPSDITIYYQSITPETYFEYSTSGRRNRPQDRSWERKVKSEQVSNYKFSLLKNEVQEFLLFIQDMKPKLNDILHTSYIVGDSYNLAFHRFNDSLIRSELNVYRVLSSIISLEALFGDTSAELSFKIKMRVAKVLELLGYDSLEVADNINKAYSLRSKLVHGLEFSDKKQKALIGFAKNNCYEIILYNRTCLLVALQMKDIFNKKELIKKIDESMVDVTSENELRSYFTSHVTIPQQKFKHKSRINNAKRVSLEYLSSRQRFLDFANNDELLFGSDNIIGRIGEFVAYQFLLNKGRNPERPKNKNEKGFDLLCDNGKTKVSVKTITDENKSGSTTIITDPWDELFLIHIDINNKVQKIGIITKNEFQIAKKNGHLKSNKTYARKTMLNKIGLIGKFGLVLSGKEVRNYL